MARPEQVRIAMRARTAPYTAHEPVSGVGDEALLEARTVFAKLYV